MEGKRAGCGAGVGEQLFRPASLGSEKWGMHFAHRTRFARTFAPREEFFPKMRFPGKKIGFDSASAEAELCEAGHTPENR